MGFLDKHSHDTKRFGFYRCLQAKYLILKPCIPIETLLILQRPIQPLMIKISLFVKFRLRVNIGGEKNCLIKTFLRTTECIGTKIKNGRADITYGEKWL